MKSLSATTSSSWSTPLYCLLFLISLPILIQYTSGHAANHVYADQNLINEVEPPLITLNITGTLGKRPLLVWIFTMRSGRLIFQARLSKYLIW